MCTVFAESEATSLMARGERPENIAMGLHVQSFRALLRCSGVSVFPSHWFLRVASPTIRAP
jgi:hypothetical protein